jgi:glycosyltransferase involved in cell wall biosynthesis
LNGCKCSVSAKIGFSGHPLIAIPPFGYGAVEKILFKRAWLLAKKGFETHVISRPPSSRSSLFDLNLSGLIRKGFPSKHNLFSHYCPFPKYVFYYFSMRFGKDTFYQYLASEAKNSSINLFHTSYPPYTTGLSSALLGSVKIVTEITTSHDEEFIRNLATASNDADLILCVSDFIKQRVKLYTRKPVETLYNATDPNLYLPDKKGKEKIILCTSKIMRLKGLHVLLEALSQINLNDWKVYIAGSVVDPQYYKSCIKKARAVSRNIKFLGFLFEKDLVPLYRKAAIFVCPSIGTEAFGVVNIEAMSSGCAVIASKTGGIPEIIRNKESGILVERNNPIALADAVSLLINDEHLRQELGQKARRRVLEKFTYERHVQNLIEIYSKYDLL